MKRVVVLSTVLNLFIYFQPLYPAGEGGERPVLQAGASWTSDMAHSLSGGLQRGTAFLGLATFNADLDTRLAGLWKNGLINVTIARSIGSMPSEEFFGDAQVLSNIEAGNHTFLMELWLRQRFGPAEVTAGLQDLNVIFANTESGALFINSSLGIMPVITGNIPAPVFPLTSPGITLVWETGASSSVAAAIFDGRPTPFERNPFNARWEMVTGDGLLSVLEYRYRAVVNGLEGDYKAGLFSHNHIAERLFRSEVKDTLHNHTPGVYVIADQTIWRSGSRRMAIFMQAGYTSAKESFIDFTAAGGINIIGLVPGRENDAAGLALTTARFAGETGNETTIELTYRIQLPGNAWIQPDLQYIIHPSGRGSGVPHCLAGFLRLGVSM